MEIPPPGAPLVMVTSLGPNGEVGPIVMFTVRPVELSTVTVFTVTSLPNDTVVTPSMNFAPISTRFIVSVRLPVSGRTPVRVGIGLTMVRPDERESIPPPGAAFEMKMVLAPVGIVKGTAMRADAVVADSIVNPRTVISAPKETVVTVEKKFVPVIATIMVSPRLAEVGEIEVIVGMGFVGGGAACVEKLHGAENALVPAPFVALTRQKYVVLNCSPSRLKLVAVSPLCVATIEPISNKPEVATSMVYVVPVPPAVHDRVGDVEMLVERSTGAMRTGTEGGATSVVTEIVAEFAPAPPVLTARTRYWYGVPALSPVTACKREAVERQIGRAHV